jgi:TP901 family phage tail tape measure protein
MADNLITTNITANADFTSLRAQLAAVTAQLIKLQETTAGTNAKLANQIAVMNKSFATTLGSTGQFSQHFVSLTSDVEKFGKNLDRGRLKLSEYYNTWNGHTKKTSNLIKDLAKQQVMLEQSIIQPLGKNAQGLMQYNVMVAKGLDQIKNKTALARQEAAIMNKVMQDGAGQLINWGKNTQWAGRQLTVGLTVPLVAFGAAAQKAFREADAELVRLTKVYGGLAATSSQDLAQVRKDVSATAKEIASSYGVAYKDTISLAADLAATGKQGNDLLQATQQTTRLAVLGEVDRQDAMKATLAIQNAFKQNTDQLTESIDFLNAVENQTSTSLADLTEAIPKAGPVIKSLGGDVKDLALYLTAMKEGGVNAAEGANAIKSAMASLINPTKVATDMFASFGIDLRGIVTKDAGNLTQTILDLQSALDGLNPLDKSRAIEQLFGKFQFARMSALFENLGKSGSQTLQVMDLMKASASDLANISSRELKLMTESASGQFKRAWASVQADLASTGEQFLRVSTKVLNVVDKIIQFFQNLPGPIKTFLNALGGITAVAGPIIMLTGVLGNFLGYIIKGIFHLKQLGKGGQGFKLLTPEIMAAEAAAKGLATSFYSDSEATIVLSNAVNTLAESFANLEMKANAAKVAVQPAVTTVAGNAVAPGAVGQRVVDKNNPLIGAPYSRDMSHLIPAQMPQAGTIFGTVPGAGPVNVRIGKNPQAYMDQDMPKIPGVTSVNNVSTGIVASEAAKWHAMTAAIAMQSEAEIKLLKTEVMATGTVTESLSQSYQALLPQFSEITQLAAAETKAIVADLQASKITVDQARAKVIQMNATVEAMLAETAAATAAGMGRTVNLTTVPLTSQPVVDPATGKSNMKEMFHKGTTKEIADRIARALGGVRTSGAGYNIHTTKPQQLNSGGRVYNPSRDGNIVPGDTSINYDNTPAVLQEGGYVLNQGASKNNPDLVSLAKNSRNSGGKIVPAVVTPGETYFPPEVADTMMPTLEKANKGSKISLRNVGGYIGGLVKRSKKNYGISFEDSEQMRRYVEYHTSSDFDQYAKAASIANDAEALVALGLSPEEAVKEADRWFEKRYNKALENNNGVFKQSEFDKVTQESYSDLQKDLKKRYGITKPISKEWRTLSKSGSQQMKAQRWRYTSGKVDYTVRNKIFDLLGEPGKRLKKEAGFANQERAHYTSGSTQAKSGFNYLGQAVIQPWEINQLAHELSRYGVIQNSFSLSSAENKQQFDRIAKNLGYLDHDDMLESLKGKKSSPAKPPRVFKVENGMTAPLRKMVSSSPAQFKNYMRLPAVARMLAMAGARFNAGGAVGGSVRKDKHNYGKLPAWIIRNEKIKNLANTDPAHGVLQIGKYHPALHVRNQYVAPSVRYKSNYEPFTWDKGPNAGQTFYSPRRTGGAPAFETGTIETRAKTALYNYMQGDYQAINDPAVQAYLSTIRTKFTGTLHRGVRNISTLPPVISNLIKEGRWDELVGKEFIMRRSSWSTNKDTAEGFGQLQLIANVKNRNAVPASEIFPDLTFQSPQGPVKVNESEVYMGGKFRVVAANKNKLKLQAIYDAARENGGPVNSGRPYLVGEKGPEIFVPKNAGGIIPGYNIGGMVKSMIMSSLGYMGGSALGGMTGLPGGAMIGGMLGSMFGMGGIGSPSARKGPILNNEFGQKAFSTIKPLSQTAAKLADMGTAGSKAGAVMSRLGPIFGRLVASITPAGLAISGATLAVTAGAIAWKKHNEHLRIGMLQYSLTAEAAKKAGVKFTDYNTKLADTVANIKAIRERNQLLYESMESAGMPIEMTIEQYKKLRKEVKDSYADQIKLINQTKGPGDTRKLAEDLKIQLMAAGMSAEDATKKIWAMFKLSEKAKDAATFTLGNSGFNKIKDGQSVAVSAISKYSAAAKEGGREGAGAVQTGLTSIDAGIQDMIARSKKAAKADKSGNTKVLTEYQAQEAMLNKLNSLESSKARLTKATRDEMIKQNPELKKIINPLDTIVSLWGKMNLAAKGFTGNLEALGPKAVETLSKIADAVSEATVSANKKDLLKTQYDYLQRLTDQQKALTKAAKGQSVAQQISTKDQLKALQKQIDANNKLADARLKALDAAKQEGDIAREIAKKQAEYDAALATGNAAAAQQASLDIQGLQSDQQYLSQKKAIEDALKLQNAPLEAKIKAINEGQEKLSNQAALAAESLGKINEKIATQKQKIDDVNSAMTTFRINAIAAGKTLEEYALTKEGKQDAAAVVNNSKVAGIKVPASSGGQYVGSTFVPNTKNVGSQALDLITKTEDAVTSALSSKGIQMGSGDIYIVGKDGKKTKVDATSYQDGKKSNAGINRSMVNGKEKLSVQALQLVAEKIPTKEGTEFFIKDTKYKITGPVGSNGYLPIEKAGYGAMNLNPKIPTIVGDRGPELAFGGMIIPNMAKVPFSSPRYDVNKANLRFDPMRDNSSGSVINLTQNIYPSDGMNTDAFVRQVVQQTKQAIGQDTKLNAKMVGNSMNVSIKS